MENITENSKKRGAGSAGSSGRKPADGNSRRRSLNKGYNRGRQKPSAMKEKKTAKQNQKHTNQKGKAAVISGSPVSADKKGISKSAGKQNQNKIKSNKQKRKDNAQEKRIRTRGTGDPLRIIPLGGMKEIGKNITLIEFRNQILIIDCGMSFPEDEMFGIDVVIPDFSYLKENANKIKGLLITHGHEDHIGAVPYLLKEINVPIYGSALACGLIENKLTEHNMRADLRTIHAGDIFNVGIFRVEAVRTNHSIADSMAFSIKCDGGHIVHTGDFKVDYTPLDGKRIDISRLAALGDEGVDVMLCDSTNVLRSGYTPSEKIVIDSMNRIFDKTDKRIIIATFSSNIYRLKYFMEASILHGRQIAVSGRSMEKCVKLATELGYLDLPETAFVDIRKINNIPDSRLTIVTTGSQGEPMSALTRMANDNHKAVKLKKGDVVVFSSSPIPGNEKTITNVVNKLYEKQVKVFQSDSVDIHVSGHACKEELKLMHSLIRPKYFIPAHGEYRHLVEHAELAESMGMNKGSIFILSNGDSVVIKNKQAKKEAGYTSAEDVLVDGYGIGDVGNVVLRDRKQLSEAGLIVISAAIDSNSGLLAAPPELITRGFIYVKENGTLIEEATNVVYEAIDQMGRGETKDLQAVKGALRDAMRSFIYKKTKRNPVILPVILYV